MAIPARLWLCNDAADITRCAAQANVGDFLLNQQNTQLFVAGQSGALVHTVPPAGIPTATASAIGGVKEAANVAALTVGAGSAGSGTVDVGAAFTQATLNNNFATLASKINAMRTALINAGIMVGP